MVQEAERTGVGLGRIACGNVAIEIAQGTSENMVARAVVMQLRAQATGERIAVERDDGEDVLIKKRRGQPDFAVAVVSNTVDGVSIDVERE